MHGFIQIRGARTNNLKNINIDIPLKKFTIVTGVSGSGKSSLAFDTIYAEGQRRYVESLSTYTRQFLERIPKPDLDSIENICPAIALEQKNHILNSRSTVATMSELYDYFRLLYAKIGKTFCHSCEDLVQIDTPTSVALMLDEKKSNNFRFYILSPIELSTKNKTAWSDTRKALLQNGFEKVLLKKIENQEPDLSSLSELNKIPPKTQNAYLVIDRMALPDSPKDDPRLLEALEQGFEHGLGKLTLAFITSKNSNENIWSFQSYSSQFRCDKCNIEYRQPEPNLFSFNSPLGACASCSGFGHNLELDENLVVPDPKKTIKNGAVDPFTKPAYQDWHHDLIKFCEKNNIQTGKRYEDLPKEQKKIIWDGVTSNKPSKSKKGFNGIRACFEELKAWKYKLHVRVFIRRYQTTRLCLACNGSRLTQESLSVKISNKNIADILGQSIENSLKYFNDLKLNSYDKTIAKEVLIQIRNRLDFLNNVGIGYLTLNRLSKTLSGGECQRINLATQLGNKLYSTLYVLDEPSIGLHPSDTDKLIGLMHKLRDHGNTIVVVEHDLDVIRSADYMVELGPMAGHKGGELIVQGNMHDVLDSKGCLTSKYLTGVFRIEPRQILRPKAQSHIKLVGASENNLKEIDVEFPLQQLVCVSGVSGSGKTTLVQKTLYNALSRVFHRNNLEVGKFQRIYGGDLISDIVLLDQKPIGKSARSIPATYLKIWDDIRKAFANQSLALRRGYSPQDFSFNVDGGRCTACKGAGEITLDMHFMSDICLPCEDCDGKRFKKTILEVEFKKKNVFDILNTTIDECIDLFREYPSIGRKLQTLKSVGLGYLKLGQSSTTLSGGESQRLKIASVLESKSASNVLYIFDEPTTGLHLEDTKRLLRVLQELVDQKNSVIVIEHNIDFIGQADWVIDIGPGGGEHGGEIVAAGTPSDIMNAPRSLTGKYLKNLYKI